jgi:hypothetical protein
MREERTPHIVSMVLTDHGCHRYIDGQPERPCPICDCPPHEWPTDYGECLTGVKCLKCEAEWPAGEVSLGEEEEEGE